MLTKEDHDFIDFLFGKLGNFKMQRDFFMLRGCATCYFPNSKKQQWFPMLCSKDFTLYFKMMYNYVTAFQ